MTEKEFWLFLRSTLGKGMGKDHYEVPVSIISEMGELLLKKTSAIKTQSIIIMTLAHHPTKKALNVLKAYVKNPDEVHN